MGLDQYKELKKHADKFGQWQIWREKALEHLRNRIAEAKNKTQKDRWGWFQKIDHSDLVCIFLWEKNVEAAWCEAQEGGCSNDLWLELAAKRDKEHPEDAVPIYQRQIEPTLDGRITRHTRRPSVSFGKCAD